MRKKKASNAAERALQAAIAEETRGLQQTIAQKDVEIAGLRASLAQIVKIAGGKASEAPRAKVVPSVDQQAILAGVLGRPADPSLEVVSEEDGPPLAGEDNLGPGRWA